MKDFLIVKFRLYCVNVTDNHDKKKQNRLQKEVHCQNESGIRKKGKKEHQAEYHHGEKLTVWIINGGRRRINYRATQ